jgi:PKD domain.
MGTLTYNFSISDSQAASVGTGTGVAYSWDFNGEATAVAASGSHTFSSRGLKTVTLTVTTTGLDGTTTLTDSYSMDMNVERSLYGDVTSDLDLDGDYVLSGQLQVKDGATLTIAAGSNIYALSDDGNGNAPAIVVWQGGMIEAVGTASAPIIMTSIIARDEPDRLPIVGGRAWGGLIVCGYAPIQGGGTRTVEGVASVPYGGTDAADDSGTLRYVSVRYGGRAIAPDNEINGITLAGVGTGTEVSYCEVAYNFDDGFEMFGGTVDLRYCMVYKVGDDGFDTDTGYQGTGQFLV